MIGVDSAVERRAIERIVGYESVRRLLATDPSVVRTRFVLISYEIRTGCHELLILESLALVRGEETIIVPEVIYP